MARDIPIIFSAPMVRALLGERKTMTRRLATSSWQKVRFGDRLWVREAFMPRPCFERAAKPHYRSDNDRPEWRGLWRPSIHMPRWASRLTLVVTATKTERLQMIDESDANSEGALWHDGGGVGHSGWRHNPEDGYVFGTARDSFRRLWVSLHGPDGWDTDPEVVALTFTVHQTNIDALRSQEQKP